MRCFTALLCCPERPMVISPLVPVGPASADITAIKKPRLGLPVGVFRWQSGVSRDCLCTDGTLVAAGLLAKIKIAKTELPIRRLSNQITTRQQRSGREGAVSRAVHGGGVFHDCQTHINLVINWILIVIWRNTTHQSRFFDALRAPPRPCQANTLERK